MKYIVYKTTNLINNFIYVGVHKTTTPDVFDGYLGCGAYISRPSSYNKSKTLLHLALVLFGVENFKRETLGVYDTPEDAYNVERSIVTKEFISRLDVYNMTLGGKINYSTGRKVFMYSATSGEFITEFESVANAAEYIFCDASTISHSISFKFKVNNYIFKYKKLNKIDLNEYNFKNPIIVHRYLKSGEFDKTFDSLTKAAKDSNTAARYVQSSAEFGYLVKNKYYFSFYKFNSYSEANAYRIMNRKVYKYDKNGKLVTQYNCQIEAEKLNCNCDITNSINNRTPDINGYYWSVKKLEKFNKPIYRKAKKVGEFDDNGTLLRTWDSSNKCAKDVGTGVKRVLRGELKKHKNLIYKYID